MKELIEIQKALIIPKTKNGPKGNYRYRTAEDILTAAKPLLVANGCTLTVSDNVIPCLDRIYIKSTATITNKDGETETADGLAHEGKCPSGQKGDFMSPPQWTGSCSSYARKTALSGLLLIDDNADPDRIDNQLNPIVPMTVDQENILLGYLDKLIKDSPATVPWLSKKMGEGMTDIKANSVIKQIKEKMEW